MLRPIPITALVGILFILAIYDGRNSRTFAKELCWKSEYDSYFTDRQMKDIVRDNKRVYSPDLQQGSIEVGYPTHTVRYFPVPCPPPGQALGTYVGPNIGGQLIENWGRVRTTETSAATGAVTNQFSDSGDPLGGGIVAGYTFKPWNNNFRVGPFASVDWFKQAINHTFAGGTFLGTTTHWVINLGMKAGVVTSPGFYVYGLAGAAWLNHDLNVNFATAASRNTNTPGFTLGVGSEYQPNAWQLFGMPVSMFVQYQHTWYSTANFNTPASSPAFNYAFNRNDDTVKLGVNVYLSR